jgi:putative transposase
MIMPRQARLLIEGGYYHILTRGNNKVSIFRSQQDFTFFLNLVKQVIKKHPITIFHYCLMSNHVHFIIKAINTKDVSKFYQILLQRYAIYFRKKYQHIGFVFQNRYKSYAIEKEEYLLECARYIERNPLRSNIVAHPKDYKWSSFLCYAQGRNNDIITQLNPLYIELAREQKERWRLYSEYILQVRAYEKIIDKAFKVSVSR